MADILKATKSHNAQRSLSNSYVFNRRCTSQNEKCISSYLEVRQQKKDIIKPNSAGLQPIIHPSFCNSFINPSINKLNNFLGLRDLEAFPGKMRCTDLIISACCWSSLWSLLLDIPGDPPREGAWKASWSDVQNTLTLTFWCYTPSSRWASYQISTGESSHPAKENNANSFVQFTFHNSCLRVHFTQIKIN